MALVSYPDSDEGSENEQQPPNDQQARPRVKRKRSSDEPPPTAQVSDLPPLPASFHDLYASNVRISTTDDPDLHGGRKRQTPHVQGNWPSHVYLEWHPSPTQLSALKSLISTIRSSQPTTHITTLLESALSVSLPLHISLSHSLSVKTSQKETFLTNVTSHLRRSTISRFNVHLTDLKWVLNWEKTRRFLVIGVARPEDDALNRMLQATNEAVEELGFGKLYDRDEFGAKRRKTEDDVHANSTNDRSDCFHVSLAWALPISSAPHEDDTLTQVRGLDEEMQKVRELEVNFNAVKVKIGNVVSSINLRKKTTANGVNLAMR